MLDAIGVPLIQTGALGAVCLFFMWKDVKKDSHIVETLNKISIILDERLPK